jgi:hypothetical protein
VIRASRRDILSCLLVELVPRARFVAHTLTSYMPSKRQPFRPAVPPSVIEVPLISGTGASERPSPSAVAAPCIWTACCADHDFGWPVGESVRKAPLARAKASYGVVKNRQMIGGG